MSEKVKETGCCPKFDPDRWNEKETVWKDKLFIKETLPQIFHMPFPWMVGKMMTRVWKQAEDAHAAPDKKDFLWLAYDPSPWKGEHYIYVTKEVPNVEMAKISGTFLSKVFDGPYNDVPKWIKPMKDFVKSKGKEIKKLYFYYTTCPKCAKVYGHNYVVCFAQVI